MTFKLTIFQARPPINVTVNYGDGSGEQVGVLSKSILVDPCGSGLDSRRLTGLVDSPLSAAWKILDKCSK